MTESQDIKKCKENFAPFIQNKNWKQSLIETNTYATNVTRIHIAKNRQLISGLVDALKSIKILLIA